MDWSWLYFGLHRAQHDRVSPASLLNLDVNDISGVHNLELMCVLGPTHTSKLDEVLHAIASTLDELEIDVPHMRQLIAGYRADTKRHGLHWTEPTICSITADPKSTAAMKANCCKPFSMPFLSSPVPGGRCMRLC